MPIETASPRTIERAQRATAWLSRRSKITLIVVATLVVLVVAVRLALPTILRDQINKRLAAIPGFVGHVDEVGVQLWHGGYAMDRLVINKVEGKVDRPFVSAQEIDFSLAYRELIHGRIVSDIRVVNANLNFIQGPTAAESQSGQGGRWQDVIEDLFPISINHFIITDSHVHFEDTSTTPRVDVWLDNLQIEATGLRNRPSKKEGAFPATLMITADTIGGGKLNLSAEAEPLANDPHFRFRGSLKQVSLPALNDFLLAYGKIDVSKGTFEVYTEVNGANGSFDGYAKPFLRDLHFNTKSDEQKPVIQMLWKQIVAHVEKLMRTRKEGEIATLVPFSGKFGANPKVGSWAAVVNFLRHSFIEALRHGFEGRADVTHEPPVPAAPAPATPER